VTFDTLDEENYLLYSNFFKKEKYNWLQPGFIELYNNDIKQAKSYGKTLR